MLSPQTTEQERREAMEEDSKSMERAANSRTLLLKKVGDFIISPLLYVQVFFVCLGAGMFQFYYCLIAGSFFVIESAACVIAYRLKMS